MKEAMIWDNKRSINLHTPDQVRAMQPELKKSKCIFLIFEEGQEDYIEQIQMVEQIKSTYGWGRKTDEEAIQLYLDMVNAPVPEPEPSREQDILDTQLTTLEGQTTMYEDLETIKTQNRDLSERVRVLSENMTTLAEQINKILDIITEPDVPMTEGGASPA